jgi:surface polysaccharide O-acyltransferase-like enzyme
MQLITNQATDELAYKGGYNIKSLQVLKIFCTFLIVNIHCAPFNRFVDIICRIGVPTFLMITGYFLLNSRGELTLERLRYSIIKILKIDIVARLASLAFYYYRHVRYGYVLDWPEAAYILQGHTFNAPLWYLNALIYALILIYVIVKFDKLKLLPYLTIFGLIFNMVNGTYSPIFSIEEDFLLHRNFFAMSLPFLYIGMLIRRNEHLITIKPQILLAALIVTIVFCFIEAWIFVSGILEFQGGELYITNIPLAIITFLIAIKTRYIPPVKILVTWAQRYSMYIYILHYMVFQSISARNLCNPNLNALAVFFISMAISACIVHGAGLVKKLITRIS